MSSNGRILIVDDNTKNLEILANILNANNYDIEIGINGYEVFNWLKSDTFDLLLLDVMMPDIDGFEVCSKLREDRKFDLLPVIFISGKSDSQSMVRGFEVGGQDYISKPFDHAELLARVKTHIELKKSKENLKTLNANLEQRINQRTKELNVANQKLTDLGITKDRFLSFISGEVSTPLVSMSKVLDVIKHSSESSRMAEMITLLDQSVNKLERVSEMASFITQISTTKTSTDKNSFALINSIDYILMDLNEAFDKKDLELDIDIDDKMIVYGNNKLFKSSVQAVLSSVIHAIDDNQLIRLYSVGEKNENYLIIDAHINCLQNDENDLAEELSLYTSFSQTIMAMNGGAFSIKTEDQKSYSFKWTFKNY